MVLITRLQEFSTAKDRIAPFPADDDGGTCKSPYFYNISAEFNGTTSTLACPSVDGPLEEFDKEMVIELLEHDS
jgi:hypothetical protein